jgi:hypothetical protein
MEHRVCNNPTCRRPLTGGRSNRRYCNGRCRVEAHRHRHHLEVLEELEPRPETEPMTIGEAERILTELARHGSVRAAELMLRRLEAVPPEPVANDPLAELDELRARREREIAARGARA